jgi:hypothetical protein
MRRISLWATSMVLAFGLHAQPVSAMTITNSFDADAQGWAGNPGQGSLAWVAAGGNPGGHIQISDIGVTTNNGFGSGALAGPDFLGDLTAFDGGTLSFDMATFAGGGATFESFGNLQIQGGGLVATTDVAASAPAGGWQNYSTSFDATSWGVSTADWLTILSDVALFGFPTDAFDGADTIGVDNVALSTINPVPVPAAVWLFGTALIGFVGMSRRRKVA